MGEMIKWGNKIGVGSIIRFRFCYIYYLLLKAGALFKNGVVIKQIQLYLNMICAVILKQMH